MAPSMPTMMKSVKTATRPFGESTTSRARSGVLPAAAYLWLQRKNAMKRPMPTMITTRAGEAPAMSSGGAGEQNAPVPEIVEAEADADDGHRGQDHAHDVDPHLGPAQRGLELEGEEQDGDGVHDEEPEGESPVDHGHVADDDEG